MQVELLAPADRAVAELVVRQASMVPPIQVVVAVVHLTRVVIVVQAVPVLS